MELNRLLDELDNVELTPERGRETAPLGCARGWHRRTDAESREKLFDRACGGSGGAAAAAVAGAAVGRSRRRRYQYRRRHLERGRSPPLERGRSPPLERARSPLLLFWRSAGATPRMLPVTSSQSGECKSEGHVDRNTQCSDGRATNPEKPPPKTASSTPSGRCRGNGRKPSTGVGKVANRRIRPLQ